MMIIYYLWIYTWKQFPVRFESHPKTHEKTSARLRERPAQGAVGPREVHAAVQLVHLNPDTSDSWRVQLPNADISPWLIGELDQAKYLWFNIYDLVIGSKSMIFHWFNMIEAQKFANIWLRLKIDDLIFHQLEAMDDYGR